MVDKTLGLQVLNCVVNMRNIPPQTTVILTEFVNDEDNISLMVFHRDVVLRDKIVDLLVHRNFPEIVAISISSDSSDHSPAELLEIWLPGWLLSLVRGGRSLCGGSSQLPSLKRSSVGSREERKYVICFLL